MAHRNLSIVIADDEDLARYSLRTLMSRSYSDLEVVAEASDGEEAVRAVMATCPDLAILDIRMPVLDGLEAARIVRRDAPETATLILTAYEDFSFAQQAVNAGVCGYLLKPVVPENFAERLETVREWLEFRGASSENFDTPAPFRAAAAGPDLDDPRISWRLRRALDYVHDHLGTDIPLNRAADAAGVSAQHLSRLFRDEMGTNFVRYLTTMRIDRALRLLDETTLGIAEVADRCGYRDPNYFAKVFRRLQGSSPLEYRNRVSFGNPSRD